MQSTRPSRAFSLLELLIVIALIGILSVVVLVNFGSTLHSAIMEQAVGQFLLVDRQARHYSERFRRASELILDLDRGKLARVNLHNGKPIGSVVYLPDNVRIDRYVSAGFVIRRGSTRVRFNSHGQTQTYALRLSGPGKNTRWLLLAGVTGAVQQNLTEKEVHRAIRLLSP